VGERATVRLLGCILAATILAAAYGRGPGAPPAALTPAPQRYIVILKHGKDPAAVVQRHGFQPRATYKHVLNGFACELSEAHRQRLAADADVASIQADRLVHTCQQATPTGVMRIGTPSNPLANIGAHQNVNVGIAILDTGIDPNHPDLNVVGGWNFITSTSSFNDDNGHGTHCAGIAAAIDNNTGVVGVAPGARLWALKFLDSSGSGYDSDAIAALEWVTTTGSDISVVNMSWGSSGSYDPALQAAIRNAVASGVVCVAAAGNSNRDVYGAGGAYGSNDNFIPAAFPEVCCVAALANSDGLPGTGPATPYGPDNTLAGFSNYSLDVTPAKAALGVVSSGGAVDLAAPGVNIYSTYLTSSGSFATLSGTSMAAPHVTGAAALYVAATGRPRSAAGVAAVRQALINRAEPQGRWGSANTDDPGLPMGLLNLRPGALTVTAAALPATDGAVTYGPNWAPAPNDLLWIQAVPAAGCRFVCWTVSGGTLAPAAVTAASTTMVVTGNVSLTASFGPMVYTLTVLPAAGGSVTVSPSQAWYSHGDTAVVTAVANSGFAFGNWTVSGGLLNTSGSQATLTVQGNVMLQAAFGFAPPPGTVWTWGWNAYGQLGDNTLVNRTGPVQVVGPGGSGFLTGILAAVGGNSHTLALRSDGTIWAWGSNTYGQLGDGTTTQRRAPVQVRSGGGYLGGILAVAAGYGHNLALKSDGTLWSWGRNNWGQLGANSTANRSAAGPVVGPGGTGCLAGVVGLACGNGHSAVVRSDGTVWAWGWNGESELGDNTTTQRNAPVQMTGPGGAGYLSNAVAVAAGQCHTVVLRSDGTVWTCGQNTYGQLGDNTTTQRNTPVQVVGPGGSGWLTGIVAVAAGEQHTLALRSDGTVWAWGWNTYGELGDNTTTSRSAPVQVTGPGGQGHLAGVTAVACGYYHSVALRADGTIWTWGDNVDGDLGDTTTIVRNAPVQVAGPAGAGCLLGGGGLASGNIHTVAVAGALPLTLTTQVSPATGGTLVASPSQAAYAYGSTVAVTPAPAPGYAFAGWSVTGGVLSGSTLTILSNVTLSASYTRTAYAGAEQMAGGTIQLTSSGPYHYGDVVRVTASANPGYAFAGWSCAGCTLVSPTASQTTLTVLGNWTLTADFNQETLTIAASTPSNWVYQNTPATTKDRHCLPLAITITADTWGNSFYTAAITQSGPGLVRPSTTFVDPAGCGVVTDTASLSFTGSTAVLYLVGGRRSDGVTGAGSCTVTICVTGDQSGLSNPATTSVTITVRPLGDITGAGRADQTDLTILNNRLKAFNIAPQTNADCALTGDGHVTTADRVLLNRILNGLPVP
jgi:alpha-tubulin suppressor-like RCC1 family protein/subtilisin family serine protease